MPTGGNQRRRAPAHAGRLPSWERLTILLVLILIAGGIGAAVMATSGQEPVVPHGSRPRTTTRPLVHGSPTGSTASTGNPAGLKPSPAPGGQQGTPSTEGTSSVPLPAGTERPLPVNRILLPLILPAGGGPGQPAAGQPTAGQRPAGGSGQPAAVQPPAGHQAARTGRYPGTHIMPRTAA
jgi:hypothetical protein